MRGERHARARCGRAGSGAAGTTKRTCRAGRSRAGRSPRRSARGRRSSSRAGARSRRRTARPSRPLPATAGSSNGTSSAAAIAERVDAGVAGDEDLLVRDALADEVLRVRSTSAPGGTPRSARSAAGSAPPGTGVSVEPRAQPRLDVDDRDPQVERGDARRRRPTRCRRGRAPRPGSRRRGSPSRVATAAPVAPKRSRQKRVEPLDHRRTSSLSVSPGRPTSRSTSGSIPAELEDRLDEVAVLPGRDHDGREPARSRRSASTTGNILIGTGGM